MKPATERQRSASLAKRKKEQGLIKISVSVWVPEKKAGACRGAMKRAVGRELKRDV